MTDHLISVRFAKPPKPYSSGNTPALLCAVTLPEPLDSIDLVGWAVYDFHSRTRSGDDKHTIAVSLPRAGFSDALVPRMTPMSDGDWAISGKGKAALAAVQQAILEKYLEAKATGASLDGSRVDLIVSL